MSDQAFMSRRALQLLEEKSLSRQQSVEMLAETLQSEAGWIDVIDAIDKAAGPRVEGEAFMNDFLELVRHMNSDDAELGRLVKWAVRKYFLGVADLRVEI